MTRCGEIISSRNTDEAIFFFLQKLSQLEKLACDLIRLNSVYNRNHMYDSMCVCVCMALTTIKFLLYLPLKTLHSTKHRIRFKEMIIWFDSKVYVSLMYVAVVLISIYTEILSECV